MAKGSLKFFFSQSADVTVSFGWNQFATKNKPSYEYYTFDLNSEFFLLPKDKLTPFCYGGFGFAINDIREKAHYKGQCGLGLEYLMSAKFGLKAFGEYGLFFSDRVDDVIAGKRDDHYYGLGLGVTFYF